jgi:hypothetical protein
VPAAVQGDGGAVEPAPPAPEPRRFARANPEHTKALAKLMHQAAHGHNLWDVFRDFVALGAFTYSNICDLAQAEKREAEYMRIVGRYERKTFDLFPKMLGELVLALEAPDGTPAFGDVLGRLFHELELGNKWVGQFFTPYDLCLMMAQSLLDDGLDQQIAEHGFVTVSEPACGAGAMVIAFAEALLRRGHNPQKHMHVTATDVDERAVHMTYLQLALLGIPALVVHGNTLTLEERGHWYTPAHVFGGWGYRLRARQARERQRGEVG